MTTDVRTQQALEQGAGDAGDIDHTVAAKTVADRAAQPEPGRDEARSVDSPGNRDQRIAAADRAAAEARAAIEASQPKTASTALRRENVQAVVLAAIVGFILGKLSANQ